MKRYLLTILFTVAVVALYHFVEIRLFSLDITKQTKEALFHLKMDPEVDTTILILNVGKLGSKEIKVMIDSLIACNPKVIGINLCSYDKEIQKITQYYKSNQRIIFANCNDNTAAGALSEIIEDGNIVTHFKSDRTNYFEFLLTGFHGRGNTTELINYERAENYYKGELKDMDWWFNPGYLKDKTILVGYLGDYLTDSIYYYKDIRITPLNIYYGQSNIPPDMYDINITANIISTINNKKFINEINQLTRILILLLFSIVNVTALTFIKTKWTIVNLLLAMILFILLSSVGSFLLLYLFNKGYSLNLDELPVILLITTAFTVVLNIVEKREVA